MESGSIRNVLGCNTATTSSTSFPFEQQPHPSHDAFTFTFPPPVHPTSDVPISVMPPTPKPRDAEPDSEPATDFPPFVFHTDNLLAPRETDQSWQGSRPAAEWILSRQEVHAHQLDLDHRISAEITDPWFPSFVSISIYLHSCHFANPDLHRSLAVRIWNPCTCI